MFTPTQEQIDIIEAFKTTRMLKVNAYAGTGKSSTLKLLAEANPESSLYIAFNKSIAQEADSKFPNHVECRTTHSLAFAAFGHQLMHKLNRPKGKYVNVAGTPSEIAKYYGITEFPVTDEDEDNLNCNMVAKLVRDTIKRYEQSSDETLGKKHVPAYTIVEYTKNRPSLNKEHLIKEVMMYAERLWEDRKNVHSNVLATHDTYLKLFQLSNPKLNYNIIYLDEAQDTGDAVLDIVLKQDHAKIVLVGDNYQSIYQWRGAINAMQKVNCPVKYLTKSFRFGQEIADVATKIISAKRPVIGYEDVDSGVGVLDYDKPHTRIYRTNGALLAEAVEFLSQGSSVSCEIDTRDFQKLIESALELKKGNIKGVKHDSIVPYATWEEMKDAAEEEPEIKRVINIISQGKDGIFLQSLKHMKMKSDADITFTTAHKSKGREWSQVYIAEDFKNPDKSGKLPEQERNLLYVAATRATDKLFVNDSIMMLLEVSEKRSYKNSGESRAGMANFFLEAEFEAEMYRDDWETQGWGMTGL